MLEGLHEFVRSPSGLLFPHQSSSPSFSDLPLIGTTLSAVTSTHLRPSSARETASLSSDGQLVARPMAASSSLSTRRRLRPAAPASFERRRLSSPGVPSPTCSTCGGSTASSCDGRGRRRDPSSPLVTSASSLYQHQPLCSLSTLSTSTVSSPSLTLFRMLHRLSLFPRIVRRPPFLSILHTAILYFCFCFLLFYLALCRLNPDLPYCILKRSSLLRRRSDRKASHLVALQRSFLSTRSHL